MERGSCFKAHSPSFHPVLLFCRRSIPITKSFHSRPEVWWIIARSQVQVAKQEQAKSSTWRRHLRKAGIGRSCLATRAKGTGRGGYCSTRASSGYSKICHRDTWGRKCSWATAITLSSRQKLGEANPLELCRRIVCGNGMSGQCDDSKGWSLCKAHSTKVCQSQIQKSRGKQAVTLYFGMVFEQWISCRSNCRACW